MPECGLSASPASLDFVEGFEYDCVVLVESMNCLKAHYRLYTPIHLFNKESVMEYDFVLDVLHTHVHCECCGPSHAEGYTLLWNGRCISEFEPVAHCYDGKSCADEDQYKAVSDALVEALGETFAEPLRYETWVLSHQLDYYKDVVAGLKKEGLSFLVYDGGGGCDESCYCDDGEF